MRHLVQVVSEDPKSLAGGLKDVVSYGHPRKWMTNGFEIVTSMLFSKLGVHVQIFWFFRLIRNNLFGYIVIHPGLAR